MLIYLHDDRPFWLSPRQIMIIPVMPAANNYVHELQKIFFDAEFYVDIDVGANTMKKKILQAQLNQYNFIFGMLNSIMLLFPFFLPFFLPFLSVTEGMTLIFGTVVGEAERESRTVNIRNRDDPNSQTKGDLVPLEEAITKLKTLQAEKRLVNAL